MPSPLLRYLHLLGALCFALSVGAQADLSVRMRLPSAAAKADEAITATIYLENEGTATRNGLRVQLRLTAGLFYVDYLNHPRAFDETTLEWSVATLDPGRRDSLLVRIQPNVGGVHTLVAELMFADGPDWDSTPGNGISYEDDQDEVCLSVPIIVDCGQHAVLRAPRGRGSYTWYRNDTILLYAKSDTLHPQQTGAYRFQVDGESCASGNCCPVRFVRQACAADMALVLTTQASPSGPNYHNLTLTLLNEGSAPVSRTEYYLTTSAYLRLSDQTDAELWQISPDRMRRSYEGVIRPGDSAIVKIGIQTLPGGTTKDYRVFAEVSAFFSGTSRLLDVDSTPDEDPTNDTVVDNGRRLPRAIDEDDSDIVLLSNCPLATVTGVRKACINEAFTLAASVPAADKVTYAWTGDAVLSCRDCASPSVTISKTTDLTLAVKTAEGCEQREVIRIEAEECTQQVLMVVSPYGKTQECLASNLRTTAAWCGGQVASAITMGDLRTASGQVCINAKTSGQWAGLAVPCLELCEAGNCRPVNVQVLALPKKDTVPAPATGSVCLTAVLQTQSTIIGSRILDNSGAVTLVAAGSNCYDVRRPKEAYAAQTITVIHEYRVLDRAVYDTTLVRIAASNACLFAVLAKAGYDIAVPSTEQPNLCILGARQLVTTLTYRLDGQPLAAPSTGCDEYRLAKFSLRGLPVNYADNGWRIERYEAGGQLIISAKQASTLAGVAELIKATDPASKVRVVVDQRTLEVEDFTKSPSRLRLRHLATNTLLDLKPVIVNGFRGWTLQLPAGLSPKRYALIATNVEGCSDTARVTVAGAQKQEFTRDTTRLQIEVGEPLFLADLKGYTLPTGATWKPLSNGYTASLSTVGTSTFTFTKASENQTSERTFVIKCVEYACVPLAAKPTLTITAEKCVAQNVPLALTRANLSATTTAGSVSDLEKVTGSRAGASFNLDQLSDRGLSARYTVAAWPGVNGATGVAGNVQSIISQLRKAGAEVYIDWSTGQLYAAGAGVGSLKLSSGDGQSYSLDAARQTLDTYGTLYLKPGASTVSVSGSNCKATISAELKCKPRIVVNKGPIVVKVGEGFLFALGQGALPAGYALRVDTWKPQDAAERKGSRTWKKEDLSLSLADDATTLVVVASVALASPVEIVVEACSTSGDCIDVVFQVSTAGAVCSLELWSTERTEATIAVGRETLAYALPTDFDPATDQVHVDGKPTASIAQVKQVVVRTYSAKADYKSLRTPFGKTVNVVNGDIAAAAGVAFERATVRPSTTEITVDGGEVAEGLYGQLASGTWQSITPLVERSEIVPAVLLTEGTHVIAISRADASGRTCVDSVTVVAKKARVSNRRETLDLVVGEMQRFCLPAARKDAIVVGLTKDCPDASGESVTVDWSGECLSLTAMEAGEEQICVRRLYLDGGVDSIELRMRSVALLELDVIPDRDTIDFGQYKVLEVLRNDKLADEALSLSLVSEPYFGRAQVVGNSAIEYLHYGSDCATDIFTYEVCQGEVCDSTTVEVMIYCDELLVYNGMSPNGDGVNEEFTVLGLGQYPKHQISVFNRSGNKLIDFREYTNDWRGIIGGQPLAEGTYFYVIDLGNGDSRSGYLQLSR